MGDYSTFLETLARNTEHELPEGEQLDETTLRELGFDSMSSVSLLIDLEDTFDLSFTDDYLTAEVFNSPAALWAATRALLDERRAC